MKLLLNCRRNLKSISVLLLNQISAAVAFNRNLYAMWDASGWLEKDQDIERRAVYYLGGGGQQVTLQWRGRSGCHSWVIREESIASQSRSSLWIVLWATLTGRILFARATKRNVLLQRIFAGKFFIVDWKTPGYRDSAWRWLAVSSRIGFKETERRWRALKVEGSEVVVMGTGPSASMIFEEPYRSMPVITCNTALKSERLRQHRVAAFCIADALYFLAPTEYGRRFQEMLRGALAEQRFPVIINAAFYDFCRRRMPFIPEDLLYPVFLNGHFRPNVDFRSNPAAPNGLSVFPTLMLPFAINCYERIHLIGFDGKDPNMKNYFWKHSDEFQYQEELPTVKAHDPGSFGARGDDFYDKYNAGYSVEIDRLLDEARRRGRDIRMAHPSFVPALKRLHEAGNVATMTASEAS